MKRSVVIIVTMLCSCTCIAQSEAVLNKRVLQLMEEEKYEEALTILDKLIAEFPTVTAYRYNRAVTCFGLEKYPQSIGDYKFLFQETAESEYAFQIGNAYEQMDSLAPAVSYYTKALELERDSYLTFFKRGTAYLKMKNMSDAIEDFSSAITLNPQHHNSFHNRGIALYQSKKPEQACSDWCQAFQLGNTFSEEHLKKNCKTIPAPCKE